MLKPVVTNPIAQDSRNKEHLLFLNIAVNLAFVASSGAYDIPPVWHILTGMTNKAYIWSYHDVADFLRDHEFDFMEDLDGTQGAWVKLKENGEPDVMLDFKFTPTQYSKKEISRIMRLSRIPESKWTEWFEAPLNEAVP
jgi:hypothetical protein